MPKTGLVCDSTCDLGPEYLAAHGVALVPLKVSFGEDSYRDWVDMPPDVFYDRLASFRGLPKTSQPSPAEFAEAYRRLAEEEGCDRIVVVMLSAQLSGTFESATLAASSAPVPIDVVDSMSASQATGLVLKTAIEARDAGLSADEIVDRTRKAAGETRLYFLLESLEYLVRGGRAGRAQALAASLLNIKPVLRISEDGVVEPYRKVKGTHKAIEAMAERVAEESKAHRMRVTVLHSCRPDLVDLMKAALVDAGVDCEVESVGLVGAVIGTYAGRGAVGVAYQPAPEG